MSEKEADSTHKRNLWRILRYKLTASIPTLLIAVPSLFLTYLTATYVYKSAPLGKFSNVGFNLATISAVLGGLILTSSFESKNSDFRRIGILYIVATIAFVLLQMSVALWDEAIWIQYIAIFSNIIGTFCFSFGTIWLLGTLFSSWNEKQSN